MSASAITTMVRRVRPPHNTLLSALVTSKASKVAYWDCFEVSILIQPQYQLSLANTSITISPPPFSSSSTSSTNSPQLQELLLSLTDDDNLTQYLQAFYTSIVFRPEASLLSLYYNTNPLSSLLLSRRSNINHRIKFPSLENTLQYPFHIGNQLGPFTVAHRGYICTSPQTDIFNNTNSIIDSDTRSSSSSSTTTLSSSSVVQKHNRNGIEAALTWEIGNYSGYSYHAIIASDIESNIPKKKITNNISSSSLSSSNTKFSNNINILKKYFLSNNIYNTRYLSQKTSSQLSSISFPSLPSSSSKSSLSSSSSIPRLSFIFGTTLWNNIPSQINYQNNNNNNDGLLYRPLPPYHNIHDLIERKLYPPIIHTNNNYQQHISSNHITTQNTRHKNNNTFSFKDNFSILNHKPWGSEWIWGPFHRGYSRLLLISAVDRHLRRNLL